MKKLNLATTLAVVAVLLLTTQGCGKSDAEKAAEAQAEQQRQATEARRVAAEKVAAAEKAAFEDGSAVPSFKLEDAYATVFISREVADPRTGGKKREYMFPPRAIYPATAVFVAGPEKLSVRLHQAEFAQYYICERPWGLARYQWDPATNSFNFESLADGLKIRDLGIEPAAQAKPMAAPAPAATPAPAAAATPVPAATPAPAATAAPAATPAPATTATPAAKPVIDMKKIGGKKAPDKKP